MTEVMARPPQPRFKPGDKAYYNGGRIEGYPGYITAELKKDQPYDVVSYMTVSKSEKFPLQIRAGIYQPFMPEEYFLTEKEFKQKDWKDKGYGSPMKRDFKAGDIVYYDDPDRHFPLHTPFRLWAEKDPKVFGVFLPSKDSSEKGEWSQVLKEYIDKNFISEEEYKKKYGGTRPPFGEEKRVGNYDSFVKGFKTGDKVYYIGDKIPRLKQDKPYVIQFYNPLTGLLKIDGDVCPSGDFISEQEYERLRMINADIEKDRPSDKEPKGEVQLKMQIYKDTKSGKLRWFRPYVKNDEWFRSTMQLDNPKGAYLRFDVKRPADQWELHIYFHRNLKDKKAEDNSIEIRNFGETETLRGLVKKIDSQIGEMDDQRYQYTYD